MDDRVTVNEVEAGMNGERIQEQHGLLKQGVGTWDAGETKPHERPAGLSPFKEDGRVRFLAQEQLRHSEEKNFKKTIWPDDE